MSFAGRRGGKVAGLKQVFAAVPDDADRAAEDQEGFMPDAVVGGALLAGGGGRGRLEVGGGGGITRVAGAGNRAILCARGKCGKRGKSF